MSNKKDPWYEDWVDDDDPELHTSEDVWEEDIEKSWLAEDEECSQGRGPNYTFGLPDPEPQKLPALTSGFDLYGSLSLDARSEWRLRKPIVFDPQDRLDFPEFVTVSETNPDGSYLSIWYTRYRNRIFRFELLESDTDESNIVRVFRLAADTSFGVYGKKCIREEQLGTDLRHDMLRLLLGELPSYADLPPLTSEQVLPETTFVAQVVGDEIIVEPEDIPEFPNWIVQCRKLQRSDDPIFSYHFYTKINERFYRVQAQTGQYRDRRCIGLDRLFDVYELFNKTKLLDGVFVDDVVNPFVDPSWMRRVYEWQQRDEKSGSWSEEFD